MLWDIFHIVHLGPRNPYVPQIRLNAINDCLIAFVYVSSVMLLIVILSIVYVYMSCCTQHKSLCIFCDRFVCNQHSDIVFL